jgi:hypothetical protein
MPRKWTDDQKKLHSTKLKEYYTKHPRKHRKPIDKEFLYEEYIGKHRTTTDIATDCNCSAENVCCKLRLYNIPIRHGSDAAWITGLNKDIDQRVTLLGQKISEKMADPYWKVLHPPWNKGLTKENDERMMNMAKSIEIAYSRPEIRIRVQGKNNPMYGIHRFGPDSPSWRGGISFEPYCPKWTPELRERIRLFFNYECVLCGKSQNENITKSGKIYKLHCHHVEYNKQACCDGKLVHFVSLCMKCHAKTSRDRDYWQEIIHRIIDEIYDGRSYYTKEEYKEILNCMPKTLYTPNPFLI